VRAILAVKGGYAASNSDAPLTAPGRPQKLRFSGQEEKALMMGQLQVFDFAKA